MIRVGLCCTFLEEDIKFRTATVRYVSGLDPVVQRQYLFGLALHNANNLRRAIEWCTRSGVGAFRIPSGLLPLYTHPEVGYTLEGLDDAGAIRTALAAAREAALAGGVRLSFHPDQFVVLGSVNESTVSNSLKELEYQAMVAELVGAEQLTIHGGGMVGGKPEALERLALGLERLSPRARSRIVLENDDRSYTVRDLLPICTRLNIPLVYDVHHHRCNPDGYSVEEATTLAMPTWHGREPWMHLSSPVAGWKSNDPRPHSDYINPRDFPREWLGQTLTIDIEAKAKELAVLRFRRWLDKLQATAQPDAGAPAPIKGRPPAKKKKTAAAAAEQPRSSRRN